MNKELIEILKDKERSFYERSKIYEKYNMDQQEGKVEAAYYTKQSVVRKMCDQLPDFKNKEEIVILEPSVGSGNFIPELIKRYKDKKTTLILNDISKSSLQYLSILIDSYFEENNISNVSIEYSNVDFMDFDFNLYPKIDVIIGNPPYYTIKNKKYLKRLKEKYSEKANNIFAFFIRKAFKDADYVSFIVPKGLLFAANYKVVRGVIEGNITNIIDYKNKAFNVNLETVSFVLEKNPEDNSVTVEDNENNIDIQCSRDYVLNPNFPIWLIYRNDFFDKISKKVNLGSFDVYRDRQITNKILNSSGDGLKVLRGRNLTKDGIVSIEDYDKYTTEGDLTVYKRVKAAQEDGKDILIAPNLTTNPRFLRLPKGAIVNGSVALFIPHLRDKISQSDLDFLNSEEFLMYYDIIKNKSSLTVNLDNYIGYFIGTLK